MRRRIAMSWTAPPSVEMGAVGSAGASCAMAGDIGRQQQQQQEYQAKLLQSAGPMTGSDFASASKRIRLAISAGMRCRWIMFGPSDGA